ncbi:hypothetical protein CERSUDRAFT_147367 [Gelatoporia subvermispora B]|uniref:Protein kinase domain-containing protein n=1 Tax=Ceriporiopsis subvermispora (strain B) TaxID=914234 RepID=M2QXV4_CERS8|nr:hypothetical protein CERSUDRAFT_147367 [Gelatoporia subvermispora B]
MAPPKGKNPNPSGLGRAIINKQVKDARHARETGLYTTDVDSTTRLQSITQERDLDEFLNTAQLAGTQFTAERRNVKIINAPSGSQQNPYLLSEEEEKSTLQKHQQNKERLRVPRRPPWTKNMTPAQLDRQEKDAFLDWRRGLAELQEQDGLLLTPFERNIEVWRQLWRVLERSHLIVQIVDARNPLRFRCEDLESYVQDVEGAEGEHGTGRGKRRSLLLINKADLLTAQQRQQWADYFDAQGVRYAFFSAANAAALQEERREAFAAAQVTEERAAAAEQAEDDEEGDENGSDAPPASPLDGSQDAGDDVVAPDGDASESEPESELESESEDEPGLFVLPKEECLSDDPRTRVLSVLELEDLFVHCAPDLSTFTDSSGNNPTKLVIGLVGYPNVGKSSTINALIGEKKVSVSSTPGKTKHFQTIHLSPTLILCDCPGLVFPQFATSRAELVCDGVLPIDQLREHTGPTTLVVKRIPKEVLDAIYGLSIRTRGVEDGGDGEVTAEDLLIAYAIARGFMRSGQGNPDEARAARYILKDYVNAKLLFCQPPPGINEDEFNEQTRQLALRRAAGKKRAPTTRVVKGADTFIAPQDVSSAQLFANGIPSTTPGGRKSRAVDQDFFANGSLSARPFVQGATRGGQEVSRMRLYPHQNSVADDGTALSGRRARIASVLAQAGTEIACAYADLCSSYVLPEPVVSGVHCKLYAVRSSNGGIIVSCKRILNYVVTSHCLGSGSFATVHLAMDTSAYRQVACKSIKRKSRDTVDKVMKEVNILISLNHPNINRVFAADHDPSFLHIFLELCTGGDLFSYIVGQKDSRLCEGETKYIMYQLLKGLKYLHDKSISHRDLKPENILLHSPGPYPRIQIADFGLARPKAYQETFTVCGTVSYLPPEGILALDHKHLGYVGMPADCWSAGVIMYIMLTGSHPFDYDKVKGESEWYSYKPSEDFDHESSVSQVSARSDRMVKKRIVHGEVEFPENIWHELHDAEDLCGQLLVYDHLRRATVYAALKSRWFGCELLELEAAYQERILKDLRLSL